jgi:hypothetical protein
MASTFTLITSYAVTGASTSVIDLTSIPSTYTDLCLKLSIRHDTAGGEDTPYIRFNNDSASNYDQVFGSARGSGVPSSSSGSTNSFWIGTVAGAGDTSGSFSSIDIYIPNYAGTTYYKTVDSKSVTEGMVGSLYTRNFGGHWKSTSAINRITVGITSAGYKFVVGSTAYLYGIKNS